MSENHYSKRRQDLLRTRRLKRMRIVMFCVFAILAVVVIWLIIHELSSSNGGSESGTAASEPVTFATQPQQTEPPETEPTTPADTTPPVIEGLADITVEEGESISYKAGVTVTDDRDPAPVLEVAADDVDLNTPGEYTVTYTARDASGNVTTEQITVTVKAKVIGLENKEELSRLAREVIDECVDWDDPEVDRIYAVFWWVKIKMKFNGSSDKSSEINAAIKGFKNRTGDCFTYSAMLKALLEEMGYETITVERTGGESRHYWQLVKYNGEWYHIDSCSRSFDHDKYWYCFLRTDKEVLDWSKDWDGYYNFDTSLYPASGTEPLELGWRQYHPH